VDQYFYIRATDNSTIIDAIAIMRTDGQIRVYTTVALGLFGGNGGTHEVSPTTLTYHL
jgi:hypothetical protein